MAQILVPISDQATGSWATTPLWSKVDDDSTVSATGDGTTITSDNNTSPDQAAMRLSSGSDPGVTSGHILRVRWNKNSSAGHQINPTVELWQGVPGTGTLIATLSVTNIGNTEVQSTLTLSGTQAGNITDYSTLYVRVSRVGDTGGNPSGRRSLVVDLVELEVPDAATTYDETGRTLDIVSTTSVEDLQTWVEILTGDGGVNPTLITEDWTGTDNDPWDSGFWEQSNVSSPTVEILSNKGRVSYGTTDEARIRTVESFTSESVELLMHVVRTQTDNNVLFGVGLSSDGWSDQELDNSYFLYDAGSSWSLGTYDAGSWNGSLGTFGTPSGDFWVRFQRSGNTVRAKVWNDGNAEPDQWDIEASDSTNVGAYDVYMSAYGTDAATTGTVDFDDFEARDPDDDVLSNDGVMETGATSSDHAVSTDLAAWSTGNIEYITCVSLADWEQGSFVNIACAHLRGQMSFLIRGGSSAGDASRPQFRYHDGSSQNNITPNAFLPDDIAANEFVWLRWLINPSSMTADFYYSFDDPSTAKGSVSWTQIGTQVSGSAITIRSATTTSTLVGGDSIMSGATPSDMKVAVSELSLNGSVVADPDWRTKDQGWTTPPATDDQTNTWSFSGDAYWNISAGASSGGIPIVATITVVDDVTTATVYDETGKTLDIISSTSLTDLQDYLDSLGVDIVSTLSVSDLQTYVDEVTIAGTATLTVADLQTWVETLTIPIVSTGSVEDLKSFVESLAFSLTAGLSVSERQTWVESLSVDGVATLAVADLQTYLEALSVDGAVTLTVTDLQTYVEGQTVSLVATVSVVDTFSGLTEYDEPVSFVITASVDVTDLREWTENLALDLAGTVSASDLQTWLEALGVDVVSQVDVADFRSLLEQLAVEVTATSSGSDTQDYVESVAVAAAITTALATLYDQVEGLTLDIDAILSVVDLLDAPPAPSVAAGLGGGREGRWDRHNQQSVPSGRERQRIG